MKQYLWVVTRMEDRSVYGLHHGEEMMLGQDILGEIVVGDLVKQCDCHENCGGLVLAGLED